MLHALTPTCAILSRSHLRCRCCFSFFDFFFLLIPLFSAFMLKEKKSIWPPVICVIRHSKQKVFSLHSISVHFCRQPRHCCSCCFVLFCFPDETAALTQHHDDSGRDSQNKCRPSGSVLYLKGVVHPNSSSFRLLVLLVAPPFPVDQLENPSGYELNLHSILVLLWLCVCLMSQVWKVPKTEILSRRLQCVFG